MFRLDNKTSVITGGGSGIGKAISILFAKQGAAVHIIELTDEAATQTVNEIKNAGGNISSHVADVSDQSTVVNIFKKDRTHQHFNKQCRYCSYWKSRQYL